MEPTSLFIHRFTAMYMKTETRNVAAVCLVLYFTTCAVSLIFINVLMCTLPQLAAIDWNKKGLVRSVRNCTLPNS